MINKLNKLLKYKLKIINHKQKSPQQIELKNSNFGRNLLVISINNPKIKHSTQKTESLNTNDRSAQI